MPRELKRSIGREPKRSSWASMSSRSTLEWVTTPTSKRSARSIEPTQSSSEDEVTWIGHGHARTRPSAARS